MFPLASVKDWSLPQDPYDRRSPRQRAFEARLQAIVATAIRSFEQKLKDLERLRLTP